MECYWGQLFVSSQNFGIKMCICDVNFSPNVFSSHCFCRQNKSFNFNQYENQIFAFFTFNQDENHIFAFCSMIPFK